MLHMVLMSHGPDTCGSANPHIAEMAKSGFREMKEKAARLDVKYLGGWVDGPGHRYWLLFDAPHGMVIARLLHETKMFYWNSCTTVTVSTAEEIYGA